MIEGGNRMKLFNSKERLKMAEIVENKILTPLGNITLTITTDTFHTNKVPVTNSFNLPNGGYILCWHTHFVDVELMITPFNPKLPEYMKVDGSYGAVCRVKPKVKEISCSFSADWEDGYIWTEGWPESGQDLDCKTWENSKVKVSIGTQDGEILIMRSKKNDFLPVNYDESIDPYTIVEYFDKGLRVPINNIRVNEICQIHFVIAWGKNIEYDTSTWFAVNALTSEILASGYVW